MLKHKKISNVWTDALNPKGRGYGMFLSGEDGDEADEAYAEVATTLCNQVFRLEQEKSMKTKIRGLKSIELFNVTEGDTEKSGLRISTEDNTFIEIRWDHAEQATVRKDDDADGYEITITPGTGFTFLLGHYVVKKKKRQQTTGGGRFPTGFPTLTFIFLNVKGMHLNPGEFTLSELYKSEIAAAKAAKGGTGCTIS